MEYVELKENIGVILSRTNVGVINNILIDTGINKETGRQLRKLLDEQKIRVEKVYNTHGHIDHIGANIYFYNKGCKIHIPEKEDVFLRYPEMVGFFMDYPDLKPIKPIKEISTEIDIPHVPLPGHSLNQVGYIVEDVFFCGDAIVSESFIEKHRILYHTDISAQKHTLKKLLEIKAEYWIPSHSEDILGNPRPLIKKNLTNIIDTEETILDLCDGKTSEELLKQLIEYKGIQILQKIEFFVYRKLLQNYLSSMYKEGKITYDYSHGTVVWKVI